VHRFLCSDFQQRQPVAALPDVDLLKPRPRSLARTGWQPDKDHLQFKLYQFPAN